MIAIQSTGPFSHGPAAYFESEASIEPWIRKQWGAQLSGVGRSQDGEFWHVYLHALPGDIERGHMYHVFPIAVTP